MVLIAVVQTELAKRRYHLHDNCTAADLAEALTADAENITDIKPERMRLIAQGRELQPSDKLESLGEFYFRKHSVILREVSLDACREWQRTGRCTNKACQRKATHNMEHSPRYVEHQPSSQSSQSSSAASTPPSSPPLPSRPAICSPCTPPHHHHQQHQAQQTLTQRPTRPPTINTSAASTLQFSSPPYYPAAYPGMLSQHQQQHHQQHQPPVEFPQHTTMLLNSQFSAPAPATLQEVPWAGPGVITVGGRVMEEPYASSPCAWQSPGAGAHAVPSSPCVASSWQAGSAMPSSPCAWQSGGMLQSGMFDGMGMGINAMAVGNSATFDARLAWAAA